MIAAVNEGVMGVLNLDLTDKNALITVVTVGTLLGLSLLFRILIGLGYYGSLSAFLLFSKKIERKEDIKSTPSSLINRCVSEYVACGENGSPLSGIEGIVNKNLLRMSFLGISYKTIERFCVFLELASAILVLPVVFLTGDIAYIFLYGSVYVIYRAVLLFFDANVLRERLFYGLTTYINKELGRFFISDDNAGLRIFKNEIHSVLMEQASILQNSINNLTSSVTEVTKASYGTMQNYVGNILKTYDDLGSDLKQPVEKFAGLFSDFSKAAEAMRQSGEKLYVNVGLMDDKLNVITEALEKNTDVSTKNIERTSVVFDELTKNLKSFNVAYKALETEIASVKGVQALLDESVRSYEQTLQKNVVDFGDAVGRIAEYKGKEAADTLNDTISKHVIQFQSDTARILDKMAALFEQAYQQNKSEIQVLYRIEDMLKNQQS